MLSALTAAILARALSVGDFGALRLAQTSVLLLAGLFELGFMYPAARLAALQGVEDRRCTLGATLVLYAPIMGLLAATVTAISWPMGWWVDPAAAQPLRMCAAFAGAFVMQSLLLQMTQGMGRLHLYALFSTGGQALYLAAVWVLMHLGGGLTAGAAAGIQGGALSFGWLGLAWLLRPRLTGLRANLHILRAEARRYGRSMYVGRVLGTITYSTDVLLVAVFAGAEDVAYYAAAASLTSVLLMVPAGLSASLFQAMARSESLRSRWIVAHIVASIGPASALVLFRHRAVVLVFSDAFTKAEELVLPLALAAAAGGVSRVFNSFLAAQGNGLAIRNTALLLTACNVTLNASLIPLFGASGAAWASAIALSINLIAHVRQYRRHVDARTHETVITDARIVEA